MAEYTPFSKINYDLFKQNYDPNLPYNQQSQTIQQKYNEDLFNKYSSIASEEPKLGFLDKLTGGLENLFSAYGAEMPQVPNLDYGYNMPTFDLATGITNTSAALPFRSMVDMQEAANQDIVQQIIAENAAKLSPVMSSVMYDEFPPGFSFKPQGLPLQNLGMDTSYGVASEPDVEQVKSLTEEAPSQGVASLKNLMPGSLFGTLLSGIFGKDPPEVRAIKDFYAKNYGVNTAGSVASGIMQGYNPVSGGFLHYMTGGKYGEPMQVGLAPAIRNRIENIAKRRAPQTEASRAKIAELQRLAAKDTNIRARAAAPDVYSKADKLGLTGPGGGFKSAGTNENFSNKTGRGRTGY